ncbi:MAG: hypothetical protein ABSE18_02525 [Minisyncoccia bacterium]
MIDKITDLAGKKDKTAAEDAELEKLCREFDDLDEKIQDVERKVELSKYQPVDAATLAKVQALESLILDTKLSEKVKRIESLVGPDNNICRPYAYARESVNRMANNMSESEKERMGNPEGEVSSLSVADLRLININHNRHRRLADLYDVFENPHALDVQAKTKSEEPRFSGFEQVKYYDESRLAALLSHLGIRNYKGKLEPLLKSLLEEFPPEFYAPVTDIRYVNRHDDDDVDVIADAPDSGGFTSLIKGSKRIAEVEFLCHKKLPWQSEANIKAVLTHELAHHLDWTDSDHLTYSERIDFLLEMIDLVQKPVKQRPDDYYIDVDLPREFIAKEEELKASDRFRTASEEERRMMLAGLNQELLSRQAQEFWADLVETYVNYPERMIHHPSTFTFVEKWLSASGIDPNKFKNPYTFRERMKQLKQKRRGR